MCQGACQLVHGPPPEVGVISQHFGHMQTVEMHLALPSELHWYGASLGSLQSQACRAPYYNGGNSNYSRNSNTTVVTPTTFTIVMMVMTVFVPCTESGSLVPLCYLLGYLFYLLLSYLLSYLFSYLLSCFEHARYTVYACHQVLQHHLSSLYLAHAGAELVSALYIVS